MLRVFGTILTALMLPGLAAAQERTPSHCLAFAERDLPLRTVASDPLSFDQVRITYVDHSMYRIDTLGGLSVVTDYNGYIGPNAVRPDVVTMNKGHSSHYTDFPDPEIPHVLRGWDPKGGVADHHLELGEMLIRNVTTDIRSQWTGQEPDGNSIFVFEVAGLCIGHFGHLHHVPSDAQFARVGRLDVAMIAVDGGLTLPIPDVIKVLDRMKAQVVLPMHWFGRASLDRFLSDLSPVYDVVRMDGHSIVTSLERLPSRKSVFVVEPQFASGDIFDD